MLIKIKISFKALAILASLVSSQAMAQQSTTRSMSFEQCLQVIRNTSNQLGMAPVNIVETNDMRMVKFRASNGDVLLTCSRPDRQMIITMPG